MTEGRIRKYLAYAMGEVLLVMIGILLALQVNNWNQWRKDRQKEKEILTSLKLNLEKNRAVYEELIAHFNNGLLSDRIILNTIDNHSDYNDSLSIHFSMATRGYGGADQISFTGYEELKNNGFDLVTNKLLKDEVIKIFENTYRTTISIDETFKLENVYRNEVIGPLFYHDKAYSMKPFDYQTVLESHSYYSLLTDFQNNYGWMKEYALLGLSETDRVLQLVENELEE